MAKKSAGVLMYRFKGPILEVFIVHPGGPFWAKKDQGAWSIPKGEYGEDEDAFQVARREYMEETGCEAAGDFKALSPVRQTGGKVVSAWALEGDCDAAHISSNTFTMQWPPGSGKQAEFPEVDRAGWFSIPEARKKLLKGQLDLIDQLCDMLAYEPGADGSQNG